MNNIDWQEKDKANKLIEHAALSGDLEKVIYLTTAEEYQGLIDPACGGNYPLKGAALRGHIPVVEFLINFPEKKKRKEITSPSNIAEALQAAAEHGQNEVYLFLKNRMPKEYKKFIDKGCHNNIINIMTMRGYISTILLLDTDVKDKSKWDYNLLIKSSVQYNQTECFKYFMKHFHKEKFNKKDNLKEIAHTALYCERFEFLDEIIKKSNLNLSRDITTNHFSILLEVKFDSLKYIIMKYDYQPNEKLMSEINTYLAKKEDSKLTKYLHEFLNVLEKHNLQKEIRSELVENISKDSSKKRKI